MLDTLQNVKSRLGITDSQDDAFLSSQIALVSEVIEAYCRRKFLQSTYRQNFYPSHTSRNFSFSLNAKMLELFHYPTVSVDSVKIDEVPLSSAEYILHKPTGIIYSKGAIFNGEEIEVTYTAGYPTCPLPVLSVLDAIVKERYSKKQAGIDLNFGSDVQRISIPGAISIDFDYTLANNERKSSYGAIIGNHANILDDWRSERSVVGSGKPEFVEEVTP